MPFFHLSRQTPENRMTYLLAPTNTPFFPIAINHIEESSLVHLPHSHSHRSKYPNRASFITQTLARLHNLAFNTFEAAFATGA
jgi:hypothetical protein